MKPAETLDSQQQSYSGHQNDHAQPNLYKHIATILREEARLTFRVIYLFL